MKIIYMGYTVPEYVGNNNKAFSFAGNKMELGVVTELSKITDVNCFTIPPTIPFPANNKIFISSKQYKLNDTLVTHCVKFINIPFFKQISQSRNLYRSVKKYFKQNNKLDDECVLLTYNLYPQVGNAAIKIKKKLNIKLYSIIADLPFDDVTKRHPLSKILIKWYNNITKKNLKKADGYILLNENAKFFINAKSPFCIVEGGVSKSEWEQINIAEHSNCDLIYSGALTEYSGIRDLLCAMDCLKHKNVKLKIYGNGYLKDFVLSKTRTNNNIIYCGVVPNEEMRKIQSKSTFLINPRPINSDIAKYTFPSKLLEYLASGTPTLTTRLNGIPSSWDKYLNYIDANSADDMANSIDKFLDEDYSFYKKRAYDGRLFVLKNLNWQKQAEKIFCFINENN